MRHTFKWEIWSRLAVLDTSTELDTDTIAFDTMDAEITHETNQFFFSEDDDDLDSPSKGFCSIPEEIEAIRQRKVSLLVLSMQVFIM